MNLLFNLVYGICCVASFSHPPPPSFPFPEIRLLPTGLKAAISVRPIRPVFSLLALLKGVACSASVVLALLFKFVGRLFFLV